MVGTVRGMGKYDAVRERTGFGVPSGKTSPDAIDELLAMSRDGDERVRAVAAMNLCPCHVQGRDDEVWERLFEMLGDPSSVVRGKAVHALADGSPRDYGARVADAFYELRNDPDRAVRRHVRKVLASYHRTGRVNVL